MAPQRSSTSSDIWVWQRTLRSGKQVWQGLIPIPATRTSARPLVSRDQALTNTTKRKQRGPPTTTGLGPFQGRSRGGTPALTATGRRSSLGRPLGPVGLPNRRASQP